MKKRIVTVIGIMILVISGLIVVTVKDAGKKEPANLAYHGVQSHDTGDKVKMDGEFKMGLVNESFLGFSEYSEDAKKLSKKRKGRKDRSFGLIPSPIPVEVHKKNKSADNGESKLPSRFDMRDPDNNGDRSDSLLTPVNDQGGCGASWAFALLGSLEGVLKSREGLSERFSENHLMYATGYDWGECGGGNLDMGMAYLARHKGPVRQSSDPLVVGSDHYCTSCVPDHYIDSVVRLPVRSSVSDNRYIKQALRDFGPLFTSMNWVESAYNPKTHTYCSDSSGADHAVALVGWDDQKTIPGASRKGGFIAKNSWGKEFGENGYFYISYEDKSLAFNVLGAFRDEPDSLLVFDKIYYHDYLGMTASTGYGSHSAWGAVFFTAENEGKLVAVSLFTTTYETNYEVIVYDSMDQNRFIDVKAGPVIGSLSGTGYHTMKFRQPINLIEGHGFIVAVKFDTPDSIWPVPLERPFPDYSSAAEANPGDSFLSRDGISWVDTISVFPQTSVCIKALVREKGCEENTLKIEPLCQSCDFLINGMDGWKIAAVITDGCGNPITGADVHVEFVSGKPDVILYDDGEHHDREKDDGIYANALEFKGTIPPSDIIITAKKGDLDAVVSKRKADKTDEDGKGCFIRILF